MHPNSRIVAVRDQVSADLYEESVILNLATGIYHGLEPVGSRVWALIQEPRTFSEIQQVLMSEYEVDEATCAHDLRELIEQLRTAKLIEIIDD